MNDAYVRLVMPRLAEAEVNFGALPETALPAAASSPESFQLAVVLEEAALVGTITHVKVDGAGASFRVAFAPAYTAFAARGGVERRGAF